jgi:MiaB/RimO family radical SAM methylthiotransferase
MKTFAITTLGCRVNHYEGEQLAALLRQRGLTEAPPNRADLRIVHTCSVTTQAASKSRQAARRATRLTVLHSDPAQMSAGGTNPEAAVGAIASCSLSDTPSTPPDPFDAAKPLTTTATSASRPRVVVTGCWATSDPSQAKALPGVDAVLGHHQDVGGELSRLLTQWEAEEVPSNSATSLHPKHAGPVVPKPVLNDGWMMQKAGTPAGLITTANEPHPPQEVNGKLERDEDPCDEPHDVWAPRSLRVGTLTLPQLSDRQATHQRAFLKIQDGCDAHCTYCIIPQLRPTLWSRPINDAVAEATNLTNAGHAELVLTGIFLGAYGHATALRRRQTDRGHLEKLIAALCTTVPNLRRLRLSSIEPGDLTPHLIDVLRSHQQVVPHFHLPLQSGSDHLLRRMNRQYTRDDYLNMVDQLHQCFDRPAITTDIIVAFPGETDAEFHRTLEVVDRVRFVHIHAFSYSPRPKTAAARWTRDAVRGPVVNQRIRILNERAARHSVEFRQQFLHQPVRVLIEQGGNHGRCERYFDVHLDQAFPPGTEVESRVTEVTPTETRASVLKVIG